MSSLPVSGNNSGSVQLTTVTSTTTTRADTFVVGETMYSHMRAKAITFSVQGLKPNTQYYPFFNDVFIGAYCSSANSPTVQSNGTIATDQRTLKTDTLGNLIGNFYLPANTFVAGAHTFKLVDNVRVVSGATIADPLYGSAEAIYEANGVLKQQQTQITQNTVSKAVTVTPVTPTVTPSGSVTVTPPPVTTCETWYFEYSVTSTYSRTFTTTTTSPTPPTNARPSSGSLPNQAGTATYVSTSTRGALFDHVFRYVLTNGSTVFRQEWVGPKVTTPATELPSLTNFRPTGIDANALVNIKKGWTRVGVVACPVSFGLKTPKRVDPLAQSFFVDAEAYPNGMFITSIAVYFRTVDQSTPAILELRNMTNGLPGSDILPGGSVVVPGYAASSSIDASISTIFRFDHPIYLRPSTDYCFVLKSTSMGYATWCSRVGEIDVTTRKVIDVQPFAGTMFKSENDVTWIPDSYEDIKFDLFKADFNTGVTGNLIFRPQKNTVTNNYVSTAQDLPLSFISTTKGSKVVKLKIPMHSLQGGDKIFIQGVAEPIPADGYNNIRAVNLNGEHTVQIVDEDNVTITVGGSFNASRTGSLLVRDVYGLINNIPAVMPGELPLQVAVPSVPENNLSPSTVQTAIFNPIQPTPPVIVSSNTFTVYTNIQANEVMVDYLGTELSNTTITERVSLASGQSTAGVEVPYAFNDYLEVQRNGDFFAFDEPRMLATPRNETLHSTELASKPSGEINIQLASGNKDISPAIDVNGMSLTVRSYKIDNQNGEITDLITGLTDPESPLYPKTESDFNDSAQNSEIAPGTGLASAKYKGTINILNQAYNKMSLFVTANCPSPAVIDAYIRTSTDRETHMDRNWTWVPLNGVFGTAFINSSDSRTLNEWFFEFNTNEPFTVFDVKLVMRSTNNSIIPKIYGVRTIADNI